MDNISYAIQYGNTFHFQLLKKNLGVNYQVIHRPHPNQRDGKYEHRLITEMTEYLQQACQMFVDHELARTGKKFVFPTSYRSPAQGQEMKQLPTTEGLYAKVCRNFVGKLLYAGRAVGPEICYVIGELARHVTKWTVENDQQLKRLLGWIHKYSCGDGGKAEPTNRVDFVDERDLRV